MPINCIPYHDPPKFPDHDKRRRLEIYQLITKFIELWMRKNFI